MTEVVIGQKPTWPSMPSPRPPAPGAFHVMAKPSGPICNLDCTYCFFLSKEALYPGDRFRMSEELVDNYLTQLFESQSEAPEVVVAWQGGEPTLMGVDFFRHAVASAERHRGARQRVQHTIQTNGTLLSDELCELLAENHFLVGISIDGPRDVHDHFRVDKRGRPSYDRVIEGLEKLKRHGVDFNVLCTVHAANESRGADVYRHLVMDLGARFLQFIPIVVWDESNAGGPRSIDPCSTSPEGWGRFLIDVFDEWVKADVGDVFVSQFDASLASWLGVRPGPCVFNETCGHAVALEHNGDVYSCDHFVEPEHLLGNIGRTHLVDLMADPRQLAFGEAKRDTLSPTCRACPVLFACQGECPKNRFRHPDEGEVGLNYLCAGYYSYFTHVDGLMREMAGLVRSGRSAADIVSRLRAGGRNDPCLCGSGRKAKQCHAPTRASVGVGPGSAR